MRNLGGAVNLAPSFSVAFWRNLYKFNAKISAVKFAVLFVNLARLLKILKAQI